MNAPPRVQGGKIAAGGDKLPVLQFNAATMNNKTTARFFCALPLLLGLAAPLHASAEAIPFASGFGLDTMAPAGHWAARLETRINRYDSRFDDTGRKQDMSAPFDAVQLDRTIFPVLGLFGGGASLGTTRFDTHVENSFALLTVGYGVTEDLTVGAIIPYARSHTYARFKVNGGNIGFNPAYDPSQPAGPGNLPFVPTGGPVTPMGTAGVQRLLTDPAFGYGYEPLRDTVSSGLGDPTIGFLWRFHKSARESLILGLGARLGLAKEDDPDNLLDVPPGDGSNDIRARLEYFRDLGAGFDLRLLAENYTQLADKVKMRVPQPGQLLATADSTETLERNLGNYREFDVELGYRWQDWRISGTYHRYEENTDHYRSRRGTDTRALEQNTYTEANQWRIALGWSGIAAWQAGKLPLPLILKLEMQDTQSGRNFVDVRDLYLQITTMF